MNNAALVFSLGKRGRYCLFYACKAIGTDDHYVFDTTILKRIQNRKPIFCAFILPNINRQNFLPSFEIQAENHICCKLTDETIITDRIMYGIDVKNRIHFIKRPVLPFFYLRQEFISYVRNKALRSLKAVYVHQGIRDLPGGHAFGIHRDDLLVDIRNIFLTLLYDLGIKCRVTILRNVNRHWTITGVYLLLFGAVPVIGLFGTVNTFGLSIAKMIIHFGFHHFLNGSAKQILKGILDIFGSFDVILLQKLLNDSTLAISHLDVVNGLLRLVCHNLRPPMN